MSDIFICYSSSDREIANFVYERLRTEGWDVWMADPNTLAGVKWRKEVKVQLAAARCVVALWSPTAEESDFVMDEAEDALKRGILVPARIESMELPYGFRQVQTADLIGWKGQGDHAGMKALLVALRTRLGNKGESAPKSVQHLPPVLPAATSNPESPQPVEKKSSNGGDSQIKPPFPPNRFARRFAITIAILGVVAISLRVTFGPKGLTKAPWSFPTLVRIPHEGTATGTTGKSAAESTSFTIPFYFAETEITVEQYDAFCKAKKRDCPKIPAGRGNHPVVDMIWKDALAYAEWLGATTGKACRLPTETEWEFAARAGTTTNYALPRPNGSDDIVGKDLANCADCGPRSSRGTTPVKSFEPNAWGLYDMHGNAWEWTCAAWSDKVDPGNQKCAGKDDAGARVVRGGSWYGNADYARSGARDPYGPADRGDSIGFRVLCSSPIE